MYYYSEIPSSINTYSHSNKEDQNVFEIFFEKNNKGVVIRVKFSKGDKNIRNFEG